MRRRDRAGDDEGGVRAAVAALGQRGRTTRIPDAVRAQVLAYTRRQRAAGRSWTRIAHTVGLSVGSLKNWSRTPPPARTLVAVEVAPEVTPASAVPPPALVVVSPGGYRVEGLDLPTASALLRALG
jgi:transposase